MSTTKDATGRSWEKSLLVFLRPFSSPGFLETWLSRVQTMNRLIREILRKAHFIGREFGLVHNVQQSPTSIIFCRNPRSVFGIY